MTVSIIVYAWVYRFPTTASDSDGTANATIISNIVALDNVFELVNLKTCPTASSGGCNITATVFNNTVLEAANPPQIIMNITVHVRWGDNPTGRGAGNQMISINNTTNFFDCAGPFGDTADANTTCIFVGANLTGNFTNTTAVNNMWVQFKGNDTNGGSVASGQVDFMNVTVDNQSMTTLFTILMPANFSSPFFNITATSEATANQTDFISFNFTTVPQDFVEPWRVGNATLNQSGPTRPIFLVDNTGNVNITIALYTNNSSLPTGISLGANSTCSSGGCSTTVSTLTSITTASQNFLTELTWQGCGGFFEQCYGNITLYANVSGGTAEGQPFVFLISNSTNSSVHQ